MPEPKGNLNFEADVLPHVNAAYNLARWLTRNRQDAEDVVQESFVRALRFFGGCRGVNTRAWLLGIVRNTCYTWLLSNRRQQPAIEFDESLFRPDYAAPNPEEALLHRDTRKLIGLALEGLPPKFREVLILRELEGLSYKEISEVTAVPPGTVMSRLSRARGELRRSLAKLAHQGNWSNYRQPSTVPRRTPAAQHRPQCIRVLTPVLPNHARQKGLDPKISVIATISQRRQNQGTRHCDHGAEPSHTC